MRVIPRPVRRLVVGSEPSAASGRGSEVSEWPRSKFPASAVRQRRNFGHRNRVIRNTPAPRTRRADCHSRCAHQLRNDTFLRSALGFFAVRRGGALPRPQATARVVPTDAYKGYRWDGSRRRVPPHREKGVYFEGSHNCRSGVPRRAFAREWKRIGRYGEGPREQLGEVRGTAGRGVGDAAPYGGCAGVIPRPPHS